MIRVLLADDHTIVRDGVRRLLADTSDIRVVAEASSGLDVLEALNQHAVDVAVVDVSMPRTRFTDLVREMRQSHPSVRVVVLSAHSETEYAVRALRAGASAYVPKERSSEELAAAIRAASRGRRYVSPTVGELLAADVAGDAAQEARLSDREAEVLRLIGEGRTVKEIGIQLGLSAKTVSTYRTRLLEKLGLRTTAELIRHAVGRRQ
jgi:two-component system, NarL family, invasion response regulator UvrY